jgi:hypothetical protein
LYVKYIFSECDCKALEVWCALSNLLGKPHQIAIAEPSER